MISDLLDAAFAESTLKKYRSSWSKCKQYDEVTYCPADPFYICIYFNDVIGKYHISYETARKTLLDNKFGIHSLRSGGASAASNNGSSERLIGKHGRWSSSTPREVYIKDSKQQRERF